jgi:HSP20 family protein
MMLGREVMSWQNPFNRLSSVRREMDDFFTQVFGDWERAGTRWTPLMSGGYVPQMESYVRDNTLYLKADLPGIEPKEVELTVQDNQLTLKGERKAEHEDKKGNYFQREVRYGSFARTFTLPEGVKAEDVQASYRNGVLEVSIPLPAERLPKKVLIESGNQAEGREQIGASK